jgi:outer membrane protein OmpA-like peptidoglycan-associated protein
VFTSGTGFQPNSEVRLYLLDNSLFLGAVATDASGSFSGTVPLPAGIRVGRHTLQVNGLTPDGQVRSLSLGVLVKKASSDQSVRNAKATVYFAALSSTLDATAKKSLDALVKGRKKAVTRILANGFVQGNDTTANDRALSLARAQSVATYLTSQGVTGKVIVRANGVAKETGAAGRKAIVTITWQR